jgi:hypothetical protein
VTGSPAHLLGRTDLLRDRVRRLVAARSSGDPSADDPYRGLHVSPAEAYRLAVDPPAPASADPAYAEAAAALDEAAGRGTRLARLAGDFGLGPLDVDILVTALAPDVDRTFEPLYGYLNNDVSRRRASVGLALELLGADPAAGAARARFARSAPLRAGGLLDLEDLERPFLGRGLRVPDRVTAHLLGDDGLDDELTGIVVLEDAEQSRFPDSAELRSLVALLRDRPMPVYLRETRAGGGGRAACAVLHATGRPVLRVTADALDEQAAERVLREARLRGAGVVAGPLPALLRAGMPVVRTGAEVPVLLAGTEPYDPSWGGEQPLVLDVPTGSGSALWQAALPDAGFDVAAATSVYSLDQRQVSRAVALARDYAALDGRPLDAGHLHRGARTQAVSGLRKHARRIEPAVGWDDLVLPAEPLAHLRELVVRARHRDRVLGDWRLRTGGGRGRGVVALFAGESGTGKTLSSEVVAGELGLDLYVVELSGVVDKYVGETEKNLERIFSEADRLDAVLLFDEADAVFGKRSEVKDSHDRYANLESAYLLQRLESFSGIAVLTTNLRANIDEAFTRRLDLLITFPFPDPAQRLLLWKHCLAPPLPLDSDVELDRLAADFELSGGAIRSAAVTAAYLAADADRPVTMADLLAGAGREYRKIGRLLPGDF